MIGAFAIMDLTQRFLQPQRKGAGMPADVSRHAATRVERDRRNDGMHRLRLRETAGDAQWPMRVRTRDRSDRGERRGRWRPVPTGKLHRTPTRCRRNGNHAVFADRPTPQRPPKGYRNG